MSTPISNLPKPPESVRQQDRELYDFLNRLIRSIENAISQSSQTLRSGWAPSNVPTSGNRTFDADSATLQETSRALARLVQDLKDGGRLAG